MTEQSTSAVLSRQQLHAALAAVLPVVERRNSVPILDCAMIRAADGGAIVQVTDLDMTASARIADAQADAGFAAALPAHILREAEKRAPASDQVAFDAVERTIPVAGKPPRREASTALRFGSALRVTMDGQPAADWPELAIDGEISADFQLATAALREALEAVAVAISTEETRYYLNGVFLHYVPANSVLRFVATDGHRMAVHHVPAPEGCERMPGTILPRKTVDFLRKLVKAKDAPEAINVLVNSTKARFTIGAVDVVTKLIDGTFPDYECVIPLANPTVATVDRKPLIAALEAVLCLSREKSRAVKLTFAAGYLTVAVNDLDTGRADTGFPCAFTAEPLEIGFNGKYLLDLLAVIPSETVTLRLADAGSPALFRAKADSAAVYVQMPMRV